LTLVEMAVAFVLNHPAVTSAIVGPRTLDQLESQLPAADVVLAPELLDSIDLIVPPGVAINPADTGYPSPSSVPSFQRR
jgi:aryl-alcohol dehydrogenase-like predicted oxidoreductase